MSSALKFNAHMSVSLPLGLSCVINSSLWALFLSWGGAVISGCRWQDAECCCDLISFHSHPYQITGFKAAPHKTSQRWLIRCVRSLSLSLFLMLVFLLTSDTKQMQMCVWAFLCITAHASYSWKTQWVCASVLQEKRRLTNSEASIFKREP